MVLRHVNPPFFSSSLVQRCTNDNVFIHSGPLTYFNLVNITSYPTTLHFPQFSFSMIVPSNTSPPPLPIQPSKSSTNVRHTYIHTSYCSFLPFSIPTSFATSPIFPNPQPLHPFSQFPNPFTPFLKSYFASLRFDLGKFFGER